MNVGELEIRLVADIARLQQGMDSARRTVNDTAAVVSRAANLMKTALASIGIGTGITQVIQMSDEYTKFTAQLKLATTSAREFTQAYADVKRIATIAQADLAATGVLYARIANGTRELGIAQSQVAKITETVNLALKVSGATSAESASAMLQLSQSFASGTLRGEEFNAVNEAAPRLMKALADGIGVPIGALKQMASDGLITSGVMADVLPKALEKLQAEAAQVQTISGAFTVLKNNVMEFTGQHAQANGSVALLTSSIGLLANNLTLITGVMTTLTAMKLSAWLLQAAASAYQSTAATLANWEATQIQRNGIIALTQAQIVEATSKLALVESIRVETVSRLAAANSSIAAARAAIQASEAAGAQSFALRTLRMSTIELTAAEQARTLALAELAALGRQQAVVTAELTAAQAAQTVGMGTAAGAAGILRGALGFLGGPIGLITLAIGLGVAAWQYFGSESEKAAKKADEAARLAAGAMTDATGSMRSDLDKLIAKYGDVLKAQKKSLGAADFMAESSGVYEKMKGEANRLANLLGALNASGGASTLDKDGVTPITVEDVKKQLGAVTKEIVARDAALAAGRENARADLMATAGALTKAEQHARDAKKIFDTFSNTVAGEADVKLIQQAVAARNNALAELDKDDSKNNAAAVHKEASAYATLASSIRAKTEEVKLELAAGIDATESQKLQIKLDQDLATGKIKLSPVHKAEIEADIQQLAVQEQLVAAGKFYAEQAKARYDASSAAVKAANDEADQNEKLVKTFGLTKSAIAAQEVARLEEQLAQKTSIGLCTAETAELEALIAAKKRSASAAADLEGLEANKKALDEAAEKQKEMWRSIDTTAHDTFVSIFDSGKSAFDRLRDTLKNGLLDLLYQMTIKQWIIGISASVTGGAASAGGQVANGASGLVGAASNAYSMYNNAGFVTNALFGDGSGTVASWLSGTSSVAPTSVAAANATGMVGGDALETLIAKEGWSSAAAGETAATGLSGMAYGGIGIAGALGAGLLFGNKGYSAMGGGGGAMAGAYIGSIVPGIGTAIGAVAGAVLGGALGSLFGDEDGPDTKMTFASNASKYGEGMTDGNWSRTSALGDFGLTDNYWSSYAEFPNATKSFLDTVQGMDNSLAASLTDTERATAQAAVSATPITLATGYEHSDPTQVYAAAAVQRAMMVLNSVDTGLSKFVDLTSGTVSDVLTQINGLLAIRKKLSADGDVADFGSAVTIDQIDALKLSGETISTTFTRLVDTFNATNVAAQLVGRNADEMFGAVGFASEKARTSLVNLFGGASNLVSALSTYSQNYLSDAERAKIANDQLSKSLADMGVTGITTKDQFRALVSAQDLTTDAGRDLYTKLINISSAFATVADAVGASDKAMNEAAISTASAAYDSLKKSVEADRTKVTDAYQKSVDALNTQVDSMNTSLSNITSLSSSLRSTLNGMSMDSQAASTRQAAQAQIAAALAIANAGGPLPDSDSLSNALSVVAQPSEKLFSSFEDYQMDFLTTANNIAALGDLADGQKSVAEKTLSTIKDQLSASESAYNAQMASFDAILAEGQNQIDALNGISTNVASLSDAMKQFAAAVLNAKTQVTSTGGAAASPNSALEVLYQDLLGRGSDAAGLDYWKAELTAGGNIDDIKREIMGSSEYLALHGSHADGLASVPFDGYRAELHKGEAVVDAQSVSAIQRYFNVTPVRSSGSGEGNAALLAEVRAVREELQKTQQELQGLRAETRAGVGSQARLVRIMDNVTRGGNAMTTTPAEATA